MLDVFCNDSLDSLAFRFRQIFSVDLWKMVDIVGLALGQESRDMLLQKLFRTEKSTWRCCDKDQARDTYIEVQFVDRVVQDVGIIFCRILIGIECTRIHQIFHNNNVFH